MLRIALGTALIATIFSFSPHRAKLGLAEAVASVTKGATAQLAASAAAAGVAPALADAVLRRTIADVVPAAMAGSGAMAGIAAPKPEGDTARR